MLHDEHAGSVTDEDAEDQNGLADDDRLRVADAAELYYLRGLKVEDVGKRLHLSRSTVSRMLAKARQHGVVEFVMHRSADRSSLLAARLGQRFGVRAVVADVPDDDDGRDAARLDLVARQAAQRLIAVVGTDTTVAVAWGSTVEAVSRHLLVSPVRGARVVQLNGSGNTVASGVLNASQLLDRFAQAFSASTHHFPAPALFDSAATREAMWEERSIQRVLALRRSADVAVFSVGALDGEAPGHLYRTGYLDAVDLQELRRQGVVGDIGTVFMREDGSSDGLAVNERSTGMPLAEFRRIRTRMLVVSGRTKSIAVAAALRAGAVTDLVLDELTAHALLDV
ncbi:sugar-binding transcriptional regulator [Mycolicibacterium sediminis]|uniref:Transcriptional regulator n=1 Tax=Mycolicibacterium sediminis TaxID=1286180 RepID=A0A7I7QLD2_9MYCO|nr:sugar-binding domain-containing protein [Mycolicibacterium sediminis]BBY27084.1 transcriptional regulator [Mycolicibacterium sediminis]